MWGMVGSCVLLCFRRWVDGADGDYAGASFERQVKEAVEGEDAGGGAIEEGALSGEVEGCDAVFEGFDGHMGLLSKRYLDGWPGDWVVKLLAEALDVAASAGVTAFHEAEAVVVAFDGLFDIEVDRDFEGGDGVGAGAVEGAEGGEEAAFVGALEELGEKVGFGVEGPALGDIFGDFVDAILRADLADIYMPGAAGDGLPGFDEEGAGDVIGVNEKVIVRVPARGAVGELEACDATGNVVFPELLMAELAEGLAAISYGGGGEIVDRLEGKG